MGPEPMRRIFFRSVRLGICELVRQDCYLTSFYGFGKARSASAASAASKPPALSRGSFGWLLACRLDVASKPPALSRGSFGCLLARRRDVASKPPALSRGLRGNKARAVTASRAVPGSRPGGRTQCELLHREP